MIFKENQKTTTTNLSQKSKEEIQKNERFPNQPNCKNFIMENEYKKTQKKKQKAKD